MPNEFGGLKSENSSQEPFRVTLARLGKWHHLSKICELDPDLLDEESIKLLKPGRKIKPLQEFRRNRKQEVLLNNLEVSTSFDAMVQKAKKLKMNSVYKNYSLSASRNYRDNLDYEKIAILEFQEKNDLQPFSN